MRAFSSNSLVNTMEMTAAIQYILTAAQSLGSQHYCKKSRMTILGLALLVYYSVKTSRHRQNGLPYVPKKILTWIRADQKTAEALLEFSVRTAMHGKSRVSSAISAIQWIPAIKKLV